MGLFGQAIARLTLEPLFGPKAWGADSTCADVHPGGPIPEDDRVCCMSCHKSGIEGHPYLRVTAEDRIRVRDWSPEGGKDRWGSAATEPTKYDVRPAPKAETRKQRRARQRREVPMDPAEIRRLVESGRAVPTGMLEADE